MTITKEWPLGEFDEHGGYDCMTSGIRVGPALLDGREYGETVYRHDHGYAGDKFDKARMLADAQAIAALPELVEVLREIMAWMDNPAPDAEADDALTRARALLARLEGE